MRLILGPPGRGPENMAIDQALLARVGDGAPPTIRLYRWSAPTLSFGRNQPARDLYDLDAARRRGIGFVRRPTGGQAVLHDDELTYAVVAPVQEIGRPREAYRRINAAIVAALRAVGVDAGLAGATARVALSPAAPCARDWSAACFRAPEAGEVVVAGRKLVGSAQRTERRTILQHGSILLGGSQAVAEELLLESTVGMDDGDAWTTVTAELGARPPVGALIDALATSFQEMLGTILAPDAVTLEEAAEAENLARRFASEDWTWRR